MKLDIKLISPFHSVNLLLVLVFFVLFGLLGALVAAIVELVKVLADTAVVLMQEAANTVDTAVVGGC